MPEYRCRTEAANYRRKCRCRTNFSPAFRYLHLIFQYLIARVTPSAAVYGRARCFTFELFTSWSLDVHCIGIPFTNPNTSSMDVQGPFFKCRTVRHPVSTVPEWTEMPMPKQFGTCTGIRDPSPVTDWDTGRRNADAQLCVKEKGGKLARKNTPFHKVWEIHTKPQQQARELSKLCPETSTKCTFMNSASGSHSVTIGSFKTGLSDYNFESSVVSFGKKKI